MSKEFEISRLLELSSNQKYATTVAAFEVIDLLDQIEIPKRLANRKPAVKAMSALSEGMVRWDYITDEERSALEEELGPSRRAEADALFGQPDGQENAQLPPRPIAGDEFADEDADEFADDDADEDSDEEDSDDDSDDDDSDDDDDDDDDDDADDDSDDDFDSDDDDFDSDNFADSADSSAEDDKDTDHADDT